MSFLIRLDVRPQVVIETYWQEVVNVEQDATFMRALYVEEI